MRQPAWKRWIRIGPGTIVALLIAAILLLQYARMREQPKAPPVVERQVEPSAHPGAGTYPEVRFILDRRDRLHLTPGQAARLEKIQKEWENATAPDRRALVDETRRFEEFLQESQKRKGPTPVPEIQRRAGIISALSAALAESRYQAWQWALSVLDQRQRAQAEARRKSEAQPWKAR